MDINSLGVLLQDITVQSLILPVAGMISAGAVIRWLIQTIRKTKHVESFLHGFGYESARKFRRKAMGITNLQAREDLISYAKALPNFFDEGWDDGMEGKPKKKF